MPLAVEAEIGPHPRHNGRKSDQLTPYREVQHRWRAVKLSPGGGRSPNRLAEEALVMGLQPAKPGTDGGSSAYEAVYRPVRASHV